MLCRVVTL